MKQLKEFINEKLHVGNYKKQEYNYFPKTREELKQIIEDLIKERGKDADLNDIDISNLFTLNFTFQSLDPHNIKIDKWNTSNIKHMNGLFYHCKNFNCDLSKWDVSNVEDMYGMFNNCTKFTGEGLDNWKVHAINMNTMFDGCNSLKNTPKWYKK